MNTTFKKEDNDLVMYFEGRLDTAASPSVQREAEVLYDCNGHDIILDCTGLEYISSSGLRIFLNVLKNAKVQGSKVYLRGVNDDIRE
ncbi:MAG: STAS domain-containing protein, partial [Prevotella sp.]|nr:STAS domain-containing protein [Prevotella sp.]